MCQWKYSRSAKLAGIHTFAKLLASAQRPRDRVRICVFLQIQVIEASMAFLLRSSMLSASPPSIRCFAAHITVSFIPSGGPLNVCLSNVSISRRYVRFSIRGCLFLLNMMCVSVSMLDTK